MAGGRVLGGDTLLTNVPGILGVLLLNNPVRGLFNHGSRCSGAAEGLGSAFGSDLYDCIRYDGRFPKVLGRMYMWTSDGRHTGVRYMISGPKS